ncbi:GroES-like protein [Polyplosphaeria fusca]|uniref:GroES-like protein n=1 Tax=Polyplosphaeria fusca TaxID=682080 RepID=A0A9P4V497_9PLEO|nr:GroES-like protein [Polyplosphaeria fusca]
MSNRAAWITEAKAHPFVVKEADMPKPGADEVVIKNHAVAINPVDWKVQATGFFIQKYPMILGTDVAGEIHQVGSNVTNFKKGDRVLGHVFSLVTSSPSDGAFQLFSRCTALATSKIPASIPYPSAAVLPLSISTAAALLFKRETLAITPPTTTTSSPPAQNAESSVLVWGGSSSVGCSAIQLAAGAGVRVVSVASSKNVGKLRELGAVAAFDYNSSSVVQDIVEALQGTRFMGVADCIGTPESTKAWTPVFEKLGGRYGTVMPDTSGLGLPAGIEGGPVFAPSVVLKDTYVGEAVWGKYVPEALEKGVFKCAPEPTVIEGGLEKVQEATDLLKKGVSYGKIVVAL